MESRWPFVASESDSVDLSWTYLPSIGRATFGECTLINARDGKSRHGDERASDVNGCGSQTPSGLLHEICVA